MIRMTSKRWNAESDFDKEVAMFMARFWHASELSQMPNYTSNQGTLDAPEGLVAVLNRNKPFARDLFARGLSTQAASLQLR